VSSSYDNERQQAFLGRGLLTSLFVHLGILFPLCTIAFLLGAREDARKAEEVEMTFEEVNPADLPADLPPIDPEDLPSEPPRPKLAVRPDQEEAMPEKLPEQEPEPEEPTPPQPKPEQKTNLKSVEFEIDKEEEPAPDAKFLAEKNNRAEQETRAERTNLEKEERGEAPSQSPSDRQDPEQGDPDDKIARLQDQKSKQGRQAPNVTPHQKQSLAQQNEDERKSILRMRETIQRQHETSPETMDNALPRDPEGVRAMPDSDLQAMKDVPGRSGQSSRTSLRLSSNQYQYLFGEDAEAAERFAQTEKSRKQGRFSKHMSRVMAALENFIPEVRPGNQTELNTRAAPFAAFIARMHRSIHERWGFGFLEDLSSRPHSDPMNNRELITRLEIVMNGDGTVDGVKVIRTSGVMGFDVAAVDVVYNAGPFPDPPSAIRSRNGKIYVHWSFHRDERQCATSHTDYYILDNPSAGADVGHAAHGGGGNSTPVNAAAAPRGRFRPAPMEGGSDEDYVPGAPRASRESAQTGGDSEDGGGRSLRRLAGPEAPARPETMPESDAQASRRVERERANAEDPAAQAVADDWFQSFVRGDVRGMVDHASFPFKTRGGVAARSARELSTMLRDLTSENDKTANFGGVNLHSAAGIRGILGGIPPAFGDSTGLLFAVGRVGAGSFVLVLARHNKDWKATGLIRL
jgi:TonB family protein